MTLDDKYTYFPTFESCFKNGSMEINVNSLLKTNKNFSKLDKFSIQNFCQEISSKASIKLGSNTDLKRKTNLNST